MPHPSLVVQPAAGAITGLLAVVHGTDPGPWEKDFFGIPGFTVHVTATPSAWGWSFSDGDVLQTTDPGRAYDGTLTKTPGPYASGYYIGSVFHQAGTGSVSLTMSWTAQAVIQGLPPVDLAGLPAVGPATATFPVRSAEGRLVSNGF